MTTPSTEKPAGRAARAVTPEPLPVSPRAMSGGAWPILGEDDVHVWTLDLAALGPALGDCAELLSGPESSRAARFRFPGDRDAYRGRRGVLRVLAGRYLGADPRELEFTEGERGKPALAAGDLEFNVSHSRGLALLAFSRRRAVGVDVEWVNPRTDTTRLAHFAFSERERREYDAVPRTQQRRAFFAAWARKEAFVKATGAGLAFPLDAFDVTLTPGQAPRLERIRGRTRGCDDWAMRALAPAPGFVGAVVARGRGWRLSCLEVTRGIIGGFVTDKGGIEAGGMP